MEEIREFLEQEQIVFDEAIKLYEKYKPNARKQVQRFNQRTPIMRELLVYELEKMACVQESGRLAVDIVEASTEKPVGKKKQTKKKSEIESESESEDEILLEENLPIPIKDMTENERALAVRKKQLNNQLAKNRKKLLATGEENSPTAKVERAEIIADMKIESQEIQQIHHDLKENRKN
jgi:hypothetical protein